MAPCEKDRVLRGTKTEKIINKWDEDEQDKGKLRRVSRDGSAGAVVGGAFKRAEVDICARQGSRRGG